ncbi:transcriptional regulator, TraR/DksA family [Modicisalibacter muralis]|uniref:Transcriptional regulator, TraR/DksA family n=1 Tax=Modicisalibacter muralis TaxID=119000 RepID=A0A1G9ENA9_9GAMM|nr:TraR/DksA C4-type zinc finger protein [Halomonas muralis]SDK77531.1 transcriptional regulator, TraR/DksA family [Halomonas muralis]
MADNADRAGEIIENRLEGMLGAIALPPRTFAEPICVDCDGEIPAARRQAAPWCVTCAPCQSIRERGSRR